MPSVRSTYVNPLLTDIYIGYGGDQNYIAGQLFPTVNVDTESGLYMVRDKENLRAPADARRGEFSRANRVSNTLTTAPYTLEEKTLESPISWRQTWNKTVPFEPKKNATMLVKDKLALDKEIDLQATILAAASGGNTIDVDGAWTTAATDIAGQIRTGRDYIQKNTGKVANTVVLSKLSYNALMKNTDFKTAVQYTSFPSESALRNKIAEYFDVQRVLIADAINNSAKEGQATDVMDWIWSDLALVAYINPNAAVENTSLGYELKLSGAAEVDEWDEPEIKTSFVRATDFYDNKIVDAACMYAITDTIVGGLGA